MKKLIIALALLIATPVFASSTLYEYYTSRGSNLPSVSDRAVIYADIGSDTYRGLEEQNIKLLSYLDDTLGTAIPDVIAVFETSLASKITSTQTTMTLVSGTTDDGTTLSGTYGFVIDEGSASQEFVLATCASTACTGLSRGISTVTGTSTVASLQKSHRRGASVKITDHPVLVTIVRILNGQGTLPSKLTYENTVTPSNDNDLIPKFYADNLTNQGAATSTESVAGISELATRIENASSTPWGATEPHVQQSEHASSTPGSGISEPWDIWSENDGKLNQSWLDLTEDFSFSGDNTNSGDNIFSGDNAYSGDNNFVGTTTLSKAVGPWFGGTGVDGELNATTGTTTISADSASVLVKNYTSLNISSGAELDVSNLGTNGTLLILKVQNNCTITGDINLKGVGGDSATDGFSIIDGATNHNGGNGGNGGNDSVGTAGSLGALLTDKQLYTMTDKYRLYRKHIILAVGSGGGNGGNGYPTGSAGGNGGRGGGGLIIECGGYLSFTGNVYIDGEDGDDAATTVSASSSGGAGGGGGSAGMALILYNNLTVNSGSISATGGDGGDGSGSTQDNTDYDGGGSGGGAGSYIANGGIGKAGGNNVAGTNGDNAAGAGAGAGGGSGAGASGGSNAGGTGGTGGANDTTSYLIAENLYF